MIIYKFDFSASNIFFILIDVDIINMIDSVQFMASIQ